MFAEAGPLDWQFGILVLLIGFVLACLLVPVPPERKNPTPTKDTTKTRRQP